MIATLYGLSLFVLLVYGLHQAGLAVQFVRHDRMRAGVTPRPQARPDAPTFRPRVTVQLPLYNERYVAGRVLDAVARLEYPPDRLEIQVLDDSTDDTTAILEQRVAYWKKRGLNVTHIHRSHREGFKAGALQNGLRLATGDFIAILDADFVPPPDFLLRLVPLFDAADVGMVQARWGHLNAEASLLTRVQAAALDAHFVIEQGARFRSGWFMHFNGTAGIWRRACIEDAGGWQGDTLTEDLDLSYRSQLRGWRFRFAADEEIPAELPETIAALRGQQFRWTKGMAEVSRKLLPRLWRARLPLRTRLAATLHLTSYLVYPAVVGASLLHVPLLAARASGSALFFGWLALGLIAFASVCAVQILTQRALYPDWPRRLRYVFAFMAGTLGLALNNTAAVVEAWMGKRSAFFRTPKHPPGDERYRLRRLPPGVWLEVFAAIYAVAGVGVAVVMGAWKAVPFQVLFASGFGWIAWRTLWDVKKARKPQSGTILAASG